MIRGYDDNGNVVDLVEWEKQIRADVIDEFAVAMNELAVKWFNQGCIALGDILIISEQLKEQNK